MIVTTSDAVPGRGIVSTIGLVSANAVVGRMGKDVPVGFKEIFGGGVTEAMLGFFQQLLTEAREEALASLKAGAEQQGADAIVGLRMSTVSFATGMAEALVYGTAVRLT